MAKTDKVKEQDPDFIPSETPDEEDLADEIEDEMLPGDYEIMDLHGNITRCKGFVMTKEEEQKRDDEVCALVKTDKRYKEHENRAKMRFRAIEITAKAASELLEQSELDMSDNWKGLRRLRGKGVMIIQCNHGNLLKEGVKMNGMPRVREMTEEEIQEMDKGQKQKIDATDSKNKLKTCVCAICKARRKNGFEGPVEAGLRSGKKLGWDKYGPGRTLGGGEGSSRGKK